MKNWVLLSPLFWRVLIWALAVDAASKLLINVLVEPIHFPREPLSELKGKVWPYPPGRLSIAHAEHWEQQWYDLDGRLLDAYQLVDKSTPFHVPTGLFFVCVVIGIPLLVGLLRSWKRSPPLGLSIGLGLWVAAFIGNKGEIWLFGHATDWIWIRFGSVSKFTNLADVMASAGLLLMLMFWWWNNPVEEAPQQGSRSPTKE